jgi:hypothetical protein
MDPRALSQAELSTGQGWSPEHCTDARWYVSVGPDDGMRMLDDPVRCEALRMTIGTGHTTSGWRRRAFRWCAVLVPIFLIIHASAAGAAADVPVWGSKTTRVSVSSSERQPNGATYCCPAISAHGRHVAFQSAATNLVPGDTNRQPDIFVRDRFTGNTERVSVTSRGGQSNGDSGSPTISNDGR